MHAADALPGRQRPCVLCLARGFGQVMIYDPGWNPTQSTEEVKIVIEQWRVEYDKRRPHWALGYRPPVPAAYRVCVATGVSSGQVGRMKFYGHGI